MKSHSESAPRSPERKERSGEYWQTLAARLRCRPVLRWRWLRKSGRRGGKRLSAHVQELVANRPSRHFRRHLRLGWTGHLSLAFVAIFLGMLVYSTLLGSALSNYREAYRDNNAVVEILNEIAGTALPNDNVNNDRLLDGFALALVLQELGLLEEPATADDLSAAGQGSHQLRLVVNLVRGLKDRSPGLRKIAEFKSTEALIGLAWQARDMAKSKPTKCPKDGDVGQAQDQACLEEQAELLTDVVSRCQKDGDVGQAQDQACLEEQAELLADVLAGIPAARWAPLGSSRETVAFHMPTCISEACPHPVRLGLPLASWLPEELGLSVAFTFSLFKGTRPSDERIVKALLGPDIGEQGLVGRQIADGEENVVTPEQYEALVDLMLGIIAKMHSASDVKAARLWVVLLLGVEQFILISMAIYMLFLLWARRLFRSRQKEDLNVLERVAAANPRPQRPADFLFRSRSQLAGGSGKLSGQQVDRNRERVTPDEVGETHDFGEQLSAWRQFDRLSIPLVVTGMAAELHSRSASGRAQDRVDPRLLREFCDREAVELTLSRATLTWAGRALVAIGFIGTVRGITAALYDADSIVLAQTELQQAAAITSVASTLGLAFATTLMALVINVVISLFISLQSTAEMRLVTGSERVAIDLLNSWR